MEEAAAELPLSVVELEEVLSNPEQFGLKESVWYAFNAPQWFAAEQPDRCLCSRLGISAEQFQLLATRWVLPGTDRAEVLKQKDQSVRTLLQNARRLGAPGLAMSLGITVKWIGGTKIKMRWIMFGTDSASSEPSMDAPLPVAPLAASNTLQLLVVWRQAQAGASAAAAEQVATAQDAAAAAAEEAAEAEQAAGVADERWERMRTVLRQQRTRAAQDAAATPPTREARQMQRELTQAEEQAEARAREAEAAAKKAAVAEADRAAAEQREQVAHEAEQARQAREASAAAAARAYLARDAAVEAAG